MFDRERWLFVCASRTRADDGISAARVSVHGLHLHSSCHRAEHVARAQALSTRLLALSPSPPPRKPHPALIHRQTQCGSLRTLLKLDTGVIEIRLEVANFVFQRRQLIVDVVCCIFSASSSINLRGNACRDEQTNKQTLSANNGNTTLKQTQYTWGTGAKVTSKSINKRYQRTAMRH